MSESHMSSFLTNYNKNSVGFNKKKLANNFHHCIGDIGKELGRRWADMDQESKAKWEEKAKEAKAKYEEAMKNYSPSDEFLRGKAEHEEAKKIRINCTRKFSPKEVKNFFEFASNNCVKLSTERPDLSIPVLQNMLWEAWCSQGVEETQENKQFRSV